MYHTTGLSRDEIVEPCGMIYSAGAGPEDKKWPPSPGLFSSAVVTLTYMRRNRAQGELAETYGTSQSTISRAVAAITLLIKKVLAPYVPTADELDARCQYLVGRDAASVLVVGRAPGVVFRVSTRPQE